VYFKKLLLEFILHHVELKGGSILCVFSGAINLIISIVFTGSYIGDGFLTIFIFIHLKPLLMIIGGYFLSQENLRI